MECGNICALTLRLILLVLLVYGMVLSGMVVNSCQFISAIQPPPSEAAHGVGLTTFEDQAGNCVSHNSFVIDNYNGMEIAAKVCGFVAPLLGSVSVLLIIMECFKPGGCLGTGKCLPVIFLMAASVCQGLTFLLFRSDLFCSNKDIEFCKMGDAGYRSIQACVVYSFCFVIYAFGPTPRPLSMPRKPQKSSESENNDGGKKKKKKPKSEPDEGEDYTKEMYAQRRKEKKIKARGVSGRSKKEIMNEKGGGAPSDGEGHGDSSRDSRSRDSRDRDSRSRGSRDRDGRNRDGDRSKKKRSKSRNRNRERSRDPSYRDDPYRRDSFADSYTREGDSYRDQEPYREDSVVVYDERRNREPKFDDYVDGNKPDGMDWSAYEPAERDAYYERKREKRHERERRRQEEERLREYERNLVRGYDDEYTQYTSTQDHHDQSYDAESQYNDRSRRGGGREDSYYSNRSGGDSHFDQQQGYNDYDDRRRDESYRSGYSGEDRYTEQDQTYYESPSQQDQTYYTSSSPQHQDQSYYESSPRDYGGSRSRGSSSRRSGGERSRSSRGSGRSGSRDNRQDQYYDDQRQQYNDQSYYDDPSYYDQGTYA